MSFTLTTSSTILWLVNLLHAVKSSNFETQCFDRDPLHYCSELDTSVTITALMDEMKYFDATYAFGPYGMVYNISIINTTDSSDEMIGSVYMIGTQKLSTTSQLQWDVSSFFMDLFLNLTDDKLIFVDAEYDGLRFGLQMYDHVMANNANKYLAYINAIYDQASSPIQDMEAFLSMINADSLHHKLTMANYLGMALRDPMSSEIQETIKQYVQLFNYTRYPHTVSVRSLQSIDSYWKLWLHQQIEQRNKMYKQQYQTLFQKYFDLMDSLLTYAYWYQDSNLYDTVFRWKQKSYFIFQRWLFKSFCVQIEKDNEWIDDIVSGILNDCNLKEASTKCHTIVLSEVYQIERMIDKLEHRFNEVLNTNKIKFDVHRVRVDWLSHINEAQDAAAIEKGVKDTVQSFIQDLELFVSWQSQA